MTKIPSFFAHRINTLNELCALPKSIGLEIDIRDYNGRLYLSHDPFCNVDELCEFNFHFIEQIYNRPLIINIKSENVEPYVESLLTKAGYLGEHFYLDSSFSVINKYGSSIPFSARLSDFEPLDVCQRLEGSNLINWVWIDTFHNLPISKSAVEYFVSSGTKTCLTSPDLLGRPEDIIPYFKKMNELKFMPTAICCKQKKIKIWEELYSRNFIS